MFQHTKGRHHGQEEAEQVPFSKNNLRRVVGIRKSPKTDAHGFLAVYFSFYSADTRRPLVLYI